MTTSETLETVKHFDEMVRAALHCITDIIEQPSDPPPTDRQYIDYWLRSMRTDLEHMLQDGCRILRREISRPATGAA